MLTNCVYASLYTIGAFLFVRGVQQQEMTPTAYIYFGISIICGLTFIIFLDEENSDA